MTSIVTSVLKVMSLVSASVTFKFCYASTCTIVRLKDHNCFIIIFVFATECAVTFC